MSIAASSQLIQKRAGHAALFLYLGMQNSSGDAIWITFRPQILDELPGVGRFRRSSLPPPSIFADIDHQADLAAADLVS